MIVSLNWIKKFVEVDIPVDELVTLINSRLVEVESVTNLGAKYEGILTAKAIDCNKLPDSDHLSIVKLDDNGANKDVERDSDGFVQVVCGAPNIATGQIVAWLPPEIVVPATFDSKEPLKLDARDLRGIRSNGMIASAKELDLYDEHDGILVLDDNIVPGTSFAEAYELDDYLLDIENKSLTHRPDVFGVIGFAREVAAISGKTFKTPDWLAKTKPNLEDINNQVELSVKIDDSKLAPRYQAVVISGADGGKLSPLLVQTYLARVGVRPINAIVDTTNYLMMLTGQPLHAFDYDKLVEVGGGKADIHVRSAREEERLTLLDGKEIILKSGDIVISAGDTAIGLAGAMGGANTAIDGNTRNIVIESATFNLYNLRSTQMRHGIFSEAITRFTKGQSAELTAPVLNNATVLLHDWAGAKIASKVVEDYPDKPEANQIEFSTEQINDILGTNYTEEEIINTLKNAEFHVEQGLKLVAPWWRQDIHIVEDVAEEIGRLNGFDNIKPVLPMRDSTAVSPSDFDKFRSVIRQGLTRAGGNEVLTYSFVDGDILAKTGQDVSKSYKIINSISPQLQYYRQSLVPSLLGLVFSNVKQGHENFALFELNKVHSKELGLNDENVPVEVNSLGLVVIDTRAGQAQYYMAKRILDYLARQLNVEFEYKPLVNDEYVTKPFEPKRSAEVAVKSGEVIGVVGEFKRSVIKNFKLPEHSAGFELNNDLLFKVYQEASSNYQPDSHYPSAERDICFKVEKEVPYEKVFNVATQYLASQSFKFTISPLDIFASEGLLTKNITLHITLSSYDHTLNKDEVGSVIDGLASAVKSVTGGEVI